MPHKHVRRKAGDASEFNLAPSVSAKPLSANPKSTKPTKDQSKPSKRKSQKNGNDDYKHDDTPRAFARMMHLQKSKKRQRSGLDDGADEGSKKTKRKKFDQASNVHVDNTQTTGTMPIEKPRILPGERLGDFAARVDQTMPIGGLARKGKIKIEGVKERQTKTEKRLHKMYAAWREEDAKWKEKLEERREEEEEANAELGEETLEFTSSRKRKKRKNDGEDAWIELQNAREARGGLHDVAQAPPTFKAVPREKFKVKNDAKAAVDNVPTKSGSLKRREELSEARREVIERYRAMMGKSE